jgi:saxitoxin biosynthesis operon SxtJ-like protein
MHVMGSNRKFGLLLAAACAAASLFAARSWSGKIAWLIAAALLLTIAIALPRVLAPFKRGWMRLGSLLHAIVSPVILAGFYYMVVTPLGVGLRILGQDPLSLKRGGATYWIERRPPGPAPRSMTELY